MPSFSYYRTADGEYFPIIDLVVTHNQNIIKTSALIDSGATISVFKDEVAEELGIEMETGKEIYLGGVGGRIKGYIHNTIFEVAGKRFVCPTVFSREYLISFNLLGREVFFKKFNILFMEKRTSLKLE